MTGMLGMAGTDAAVEPLVVASGDDERGPLRTCLATGEVLPRERLMRFVVGPDDAIVPDLAGKLPGRGLWLTPTRAALLQHLTRGEFDLGGFRLAFGPNDNQGSDDVFLTVIGKDGKFRPVNKLNAAG